MGELMGMHRIAAALAAGAVLYGASAFAADMPVKAPPFSNKPFSTATGSGWFCGIGTQAGVAQANVSGNNIFATSLVNGNLNVTGGAVGGGCGYIRSNGPFGLRWAAEVNAFYQNITASAGPASIASRYSVTEELDFSFSAFQMISNAIGNIGVAFPSFSPSLPSSVAVASAPWQFVGLKVLEFGQSGNFFQAGGASIGWAPGITGGFRWQTLNAAGQPNDGSIKVYADVFWPQRGETFSNVLGTGGGPIVVSGASKFTTMYMAGIKYDFGL
jgi:hypothetical protein